MTGSIERLLAQVAAEELVQARWVQHHDVSSFNPEEFLLAESSQGAGKGFADGSQLGGEDTFGRFEFDCNRPVRAGIGAAFDPLDGFLPVPGPVLDIAQIDVGVAKPHRRDGGPVLAHYPEEQLLGAGGVLLRAAQRFTGGLEFRGLVRIGADRRKTRRSASRSSPSRRAAARRDANASTERNGTPDLLAVDDADASRAAAPGIGQRTIPGPPRDPEGESERARGSGSQAKSAGDLDPVHSLHQLGLALPLRAFKVAVHPVVTRTEAWPGA